MCVCWFVGKRGEGELTSKMGSPSSLSLGLDIFPFPCLFIFLGGRKDISIVS